MSTDVAYIEDVVEYGYVYKLLNPTGRWKIESGPYYKDKLFIEHRGFIFKRWVSECSIVFKPERKSKIFSCS